jgi:TonB-linked SusC/RagA family outer membrane protein
MKNLRGLESKRLFSINLTFKALTSLVLLLSLSVHGTAHVNFAHENGEITTLSNTTDEISITGVVTDTTGETVPGVTVLEKNTQNGTSTDFDGNYSLTVKDDNAVLVFSAVGYKTVEVPVKGKTKVNVVLEESSEFLDEIILVGYGTKKKSLVTGAISSIDSKDIQSVSQQRIDQALQGRTSGVTVVSSSGSPGAGAKIRIRGAGSNGNTDPLFIVDGMKVTSIDNIPPSDIENIEVLKDAASSAIYGTEGANGVIIVTTKKGRAGDIRVSYNTQTVFQSVRTKMELLDAGQFVTYMNEAGITTVMDNGFNTDWIDQTFETAPMFRNNVSFSGGNENTKFFVSAANLHQRGIVGKDNSYFRRTSLRLNLTHKVNDWLELGTNTAVSGQRTTGVQENSDTRGVIQNMLIIDPLTPVIYPTGQVPQEVIDRAGNNGFPDIPLLRDRNGNVYGYPSFSTGEVLNPVAYANGINRNINTTRRTLSTSYATVKPIDGLSVTTRFGYERSVIDFFNNVNPYYVASEASNTSYTAFQSSTTVRRWLWENFASYNRTFDKHDVTVLVGYSAEDTDIPVSTRSGSAAIGDFVNFDLDNATFAIGDETENIFRNNLVSAFARLSYNYDDKYLFEGSIRSDRSDKFPEQNKTGVFPAFSGAWVVSNEGFWKDEAKIDYFKLRASWGQNGSLGNLPGNTDRIFITRLSNNLPLEYEGATAAQITNYANENLVWETSEQLDIGADFRMFDSRLSLSADYYVKTTRDLILNDGSLITPGSAGFNFSPFNAGTIQNSGFEFEIAYNDETESGLGYGINFNLSTLKNEVTQINFVPEGTSINGAGAPQNPDGITRFTEGLPVWYFFGFQTNGIDPNTGQINIVDTNGDGNIDSTDKTFIGSPHPDVLFGGSFDFTYKNWDMLIRYQGTIGNEIIATYHQPSRPITNKPIQFFDGRWTGPGDTGATFPAAEFATSAYDTDLVVEDGSFLRIKQIQLGYNFTSEQAQKIGANSLRLYVSLDDYFTFTKYNGLDPEIGNFGNNDTGVDRGYYPTPAKLLFGLAVNF